MTDTLPGGGAGELYNVVLVMGTEGGAAAPDAFEVADGSIPPGLSLVRDRVDANGDGMPDPDGAFTGNARIIGHPFEPGSYSFTIKAISTGELGNDPGQPDLAARVDLTMTIGEGTITFISPTAAEGTLDPSVPAFPKVIDFVNPANPQAFFSYSFQTAGGSGNNLLNVYLPRELELSFFDAAVAAGAELSSFDSDESGSTGDPLEVNFTDGGLFVLQAGKSKVQIGGFQSPRGKVGTITSHAGGSGLNPLWFQKAPIDGGPPQNSRRDLLDTQNLSGGDATLGTPQPVRFSDYFSAVYEGTNLGFSAPPLVRRKYPFTADQYQNAFFVNFTFGVDLTDLRFRMIAEAIDTRGTQAKDDDIIARKAYIAQIKIPEIKIDTVTLPAGTAGVDYTEFVNASGGVPPLTFALEFVDGTLDFDSTPGSALLKDAFGLEMDPSTGQFFGVPFASGTVELSVAVFADVMSPAQNAATYDPVVGAGPGNYNGTNPDTGVAGNHRVYQVGFDLPSEPFITNTSLVAGQDGVAYPGDTISGSGGVPTLVPGAVGFVGTYPASQVARNYEYTASYLRDSSYGVDVGTVDPVNPLPRALVFDGGAASPNNGRISGTPTDRGFHPVTFEQMDFYLGDATAPSLASRQSSTKTLALSISPDTAVYLRGTSPANGGSPDGLVAGSAQMGEPRMAPIFLAAALHRVETGQSPVLFGNELPRDIDFLPVMLANGGSDAHVDKSIPSISGLWPAESARNDRFEYYYYGNTSPYRGWKHLQEEQCWVQTPTPEHLRVFLWAETTLKNSNNGRYGVIDRASGKRGVMVVNPLTGEVRIPAVLTNGDGSHGSVFGTESLWGTSAYGINHEKYSSTYAYLYGYIYGGTSTKYYSYLQYDQGAREARLTGVGSFIEAYTQTPDGASTHGRVATTLAVSADGLWGAAALPGGNGPKILLWRNDAQPIPAAFAGQDNIIMLDGLDSAGNSLGNSACVIDVSVYGEDQRYLLPDSMMFVRDGLIFLMEKRLDFIHAVSLVDGHLSTRSINERSEPNGSGPSASSTRGQPVCDADLVLGMKHIPSMVQFSFAGNRPAAGEEGPDKVAFIAGDLYNIDPFIESYSSSSYYRLSSDAVRKGYAQGITGDKAVLFLETQTGASGLDLNNEGTEIKDLSGSDSLIYGDFLPPGRMGEELDFLSVSPDGRFVAAVRNVSTSVYSYRYYSINPTFMTLSTSTTTSTSYYQAADDILLFSTDGTDLDTAAGTQTVLFLGRGRMGSSSNDSNINSVSYASARDYLDAYARRIAGVQFSDDSKSLIFTYAGHNSNNPKYYGSAYGYMVNNSSRYTGYHSATTRMSVRFRFRTNADGAINFQSASAASNFLENMLQGVSGVGSVGDTSVPFGSSAGGDQQFMATFRSHNGKFLYYISDPYPSRNFMVGFNISAADINGHAPFTPFLTHGSSIGFEQFDCNAWNYEGRFFAVPGGVELDGRDGAGIVFVIGSASSAGATSATDLEVYAFDADNGGQLVALTSDATDGTQNALNHMYVSADGNVLVVQRTKTTADSGETRAKLNGENDLIAVANVHAAVFDGAPAMSFVVSEQMSHGSSVAFVGEGTVTGPQAVIYSAGTKGGNSTWDKRTLRISLLASGAPPAFLDTTQSHYFVLSGTRRVNDDPTTSD